MSKPKIKEFADLTWQDLGKWAGRTIVSRGKSYKNCVEDPRLTPDGGVIAWVEGSATYATRVWFEKAGVLQSECSCPYDGGHCKHAVALILVYLDSLKSKTPVKAVKPDDRRLKILNGLENGEPSDDDEDEWNDDDEDELDEIDAEPATVKKPAKTSRKSDEIIRDHFASMSKDELIDFAVNQASHSEIGREIVERAQLKSGSVSKLVQSLRREIERISREPAWVNRWNGEGEIPDYSHVRTQLDSLLKAGHADEVISLGRNLWRLGNAQIGQSDDEGDTAGQISECMEVVIEAVPQSSMAPHEQLLLKIDTCLTDNYSVLGEKWHHLTSGKYGKDDWLRVAKELERRLEDMPESDKDHLIRYGREQLMRWVVKLWERAGCKEKVIPLLEREAPISGCYGELVDRLRAARRKDEARQWAIRGFRETAADLPGIAWELEAKLRDMAEGEKDFATVASYRALDFFDRPSLHSYLPLQNASEKMGAWPVVREAVFRYLETGQRPDLQPTENPNVKTRRAGNSGKWPFPLLEIDLPHEKRGFHERFPNTSVLIEIAIHEKRNEDVVRLHEGSMRNRLGFISAREEEVAEAVRETHPDVSLNIWKRRAERHIAEVKPAAYQVAGKYLKRMREVYERSNRQSEWKTYIMTLRVQHKAKSRLMEVLDSLEGSSRPPKKIIER